MYSNANVWMQTFDCCCMSQTVASRRFCAFDYKVNQLDSCVHLPMQLPGDIKNSRLQDCLAAGAQNPDRLCCETARDMNGGANELCCASAHTSRYHVIFAMSRSQCSMRRIVIIRACAEAPDRHCTLSCFPCRELAPGRGMAGHHWQQHPGINA